MESDWPLQPHYGTEDISERVLKALKDADLIADHQSTIADIAPLDQFHVRGRAATVELASLLHPGAEDTVLDVGSGLGGPARYLAATFGCKVIGIDLSSPFVEVARLLTDRTGLSDRVNFLCADALNMPFSARTFDHVWTQHAAMNIANRVQLYAGIHRVIRPGGRFAIYDVIAWSGAPLIYPTPWAPSADESFLLGAGEMRTLLRDTGFDEVSWENKTEAGIAWFAEQSAQQRAGPSVGLDVVMGPGFPAMATNFAQNLREGRAALIETVWKRR